MKGYCTWLQSFKHIKTADQENAFLKNYKNTERFIKKVIVKTGMFQYNKIMLENYTHECEVM
jgi:precorrin isomerase